MPQRKRTIVTYRVVDPNSPTVVAPGLDNRVILRNLVKTRYREMLLSRGYTTVIIEKVTKKHVLMNVGHVYDEWKGWIPKREWTWVTVSAEPVEKINLI